MVFKASRYWLDLVREIIVRDGDLDLIGEYLVVGLGGGFKSLHKRLGGARDVTGSGYVVKTYTGLYKGVRMTTIAIAGGGVYAEWVVSIAHAKGVKAMVGVGWCGGIVDYVDVGDVIMPIAAVRDEDTTDHYVAKGYPAVADLCPAFEAPNTLRELSRATGVKVHTGIVLTTSSTLSESPEWGREWSTRRVIAVDGETSVIYTLASLTGIPVVNMLTVSDHVVREESMSASKHLEEKVEIAHQVTVKAAYEVLSKVARHR